ncbi:MAG TPA: hemerythrin domain-containing protein [Streptosporangiaceae bacterium]|nr:hemerythrin domain-containing protein [Streptosporangiaceae bacterium]
MPSVFEVLGHDHQEVKQILSELEKGPTAASGASEKDLALRKKMVEQLVIEESRHEAVEEMYFWPAVQERVPDGERLAATATQQEQEGKEVLDRLDKLDASETEFEKLVATFVTAGRTHIDYEETQVWPLLRAALTAEQADELGDRLQTAKKTAPTRPHPHTPPSPGVLKTGGPAVAAADKLRDKASGRGD